MKLYDISPLVLIALSVLTGAFGVRIGGDVSSTSLSLKEYARDVQTLQRGRGLPEVATRSMTMPQVTSEKIPAHTAKSILLVDISTDRILAEEGGSEVQPLASLTKLVTVLTFLELDISHDTQVTIVPADVVDARSGLMAGDVVTVKDLLGLTLVSSSNSAAKTLQRVSGLSPEYFMGRMNMLGRRIGLTHATFVEPTGLNYRNVGTTYDVYRMLMESARNETIRSFANAPYYEFFNGKENKRIAATDALINGQIAFGGKQLIAGKTGYIPESGFHVALLATDMKANQRAVIVLGAGDGLARFTEANALLVWGSTIK